MMQEPMGIPACFSSSSITEKHTTSSSDSSTITRSGQSVFISVYQTKLAGQCRLITVSWCKNLLLHGLSVSIQGPEGEFQYNFKIEVKPWHFWRKQGSSKFQVDGKTVEIFWDLRTAKFNGETEPKSDFYVVVVCEQEAVLVLGDRKRDAYKKSSSRPAIIEPTLVSKKEHIFGKKKFSARARFHGRGKLHEISIECNNGGFGNGDGGEEGKNNGEPEMEIRVDGNLAIRVKHLQWKFRGNESISVNKIRVEVYWDVHDWLFCPGLRHALFIFKPSSSSSPSSSMGGLTSSTSLSPPSTSSYTSTPLTIQTPRSTSVKDKYIHDENGSFGYCLFLYAWKIE